MKNLWLGGLSGSALPSRSRTGGRCRPALEVLEDRVLPATVFWNVDADGFWDVAANWRDDQGVSRLPGAEDDVVIDRAHNRHVAFGVGIHRCAGSNLARMEMRVAIAEWLAALPEFSLDPDGELTFAGGQVRGPRTLPVVY